MYEERGRELCKKVGVMERAERKEDVLRLVEAEIQAHVDLSPLEMVVVAFQIVDAVEKRLNSYEDQE